ncbi:hypothetical protein ACVVIH_02440 [Chryseobacterium arthrosphaerae]|uniref:hypothetical protein n=1 Tax=Chryseobacterium arthrosphaerae TaxID=651561 RepID=UPI003D33501C
MLNEQKRNNIRFIVFIALLCLQSCHAQKQHVKVFFEDNKKTSYQDCIKESEVDKIKKTDENREVIELMISGCKDRGLIFDNFMGGLPFYWHHYHTKRTILLFIIGRTTLIIFQPLL